MGLTILSARLPDPYKACCPQPMNYLALALTGHQVPDTCRAGLNPLSCSASQTSHLCPLTTPAVMSKPSFKIETQANSLKLKCLNPTLGPYSTRTPIPLLAVSFQCFSVLWVPTGLFSATLLPSSNFPCSSQGQTA